MSNQDDVNVNQTSDKKAEMLKIQQELRAQNIQKMKEHCIDVLMSQTTWSLEEAKQHLEENEYNVQSCIRIFMKMPVDKPKHDVSSKNTTINQGIYNHIRTMMDEASYRYEKKKEIEARIQAMRESHNVQ